MNKTVKEIVVEYLKSNKYDGLCNFLGDACGCTIDNLMPCSLEGIENCKVGYFSGCCSGSINDCDCIGLGKGKF